MPARVIQSAALVKDSELFSVRLQAAGFLIAVWLLMSSLLLLAPDESSLKSNSQTPLGLLGLQLAPDAQSAATMLGHWRTPATLLETAERATIEDSTSYIRLYVLVLFLCGTLVYVLLARNHEPNQDSDRVYFWFWLAGLTCLIFAALCDGMIENPHLLQLIQQAQRLPESPPDFPHPEFVEQVRRVLPTIRLAAQVKFGLLAIVIGAIVAGSGGVARRWVNDCRWRVIDSRKRRQLAPADYEACSVPGDFRALDQQERRLLQECESCHPDDIGTWQTEPWIKNLNTDRVGLALSGGGIRSATFNLGLLQSLAQLQVLPLVDYLSTVSGGGYIGGWLSAWRLRLQQQSPETVAQSAYGPAGLFPSADGPLKFALPPAEHPNPPRREPETRPEAEEIRHLREFSSFLAPRWGFLEIETWNAVIAILVGLTPTLILAITCLLLFQILWVATTAHLSYPFPWLLTLETALPVAVALVAGEKLWSRRHPGSRTPVSRIDTGTTDLPDTTRMYWSTALLGGLLVVAVTWGLLYALTSGPFSFWNQVYRLGGTSGPATADWMGWMDRLGVTTPISATHISPRLFDIPLIWLIAGAILSVFRILLASVLDVDSTRTAIPPVDRVLARILALATIWTIAGGLWEAGIYLKKLELTAVATGGAAGGAGLFAWIRNWLTNASRIGDSGGRLPKFVRVLLVQLLAYATVGLVYIVAVSLSVQVLGPWPLRWQAAWGALIGIAIVGLQLIPSEFGLHVFYRNRITRAFLGASNPCTFNAARATFTASENRETDVRAWDDVYLHELHATGRPLHLVCCTANHLSGDQLGMLSRGGRSAVLSCQGVAVGDHWSAQSELTLGSALTASAAAFNSEMGSVSIVLGPAVSFLLSALNLRLGIWVVHPHYPETAPTWFPGLRFYEELFGISDAADVAPSAEAPQPAIARHIHLSDGGHFENLALYELIRRHCRYIIVSDCGEDPQVRFEDFGNAVRRIREDFGVDIEIDLDPLRPDPQGRSRQHLVVGTIRFDPNGGDRDVGVLVYFKPTLTGDEPCDITNYRTLNPTFPHETTGDQFYDEAQWESYRRLGSHAAFEAFSMLDGGRAPEKYEVFAKVRERWYPTPAHLDDKLAALNGRFIEFEHRLADIAPVRFMAELFPELSTNLTPRTNRGPLQREEDTLAELHLLLEMIQIMEDIVLSVDFRKNFNNPLLLGWVNVFHRWAHADTFRAWWPILSPLYSPQLRKFAEERFDLADTKSNRTGAATIVVEFRPDQRPAEFDRRLHEVLKRSSLTGRETQATHRALFVLKLQQGTTQVQADVGLVQFTYVGADGGQPRIEWHDADFLIVPGLWGAGLGGAFLREFRLRLASEFPLLTRPRPLGPAGVLRVIIDLDRTKGTGFIHRDTGHRRERNDLLQFYKSHGFRPVGHEPHGQTTMRLDCSELLPSP